MLSSCMDHLAHQRINAVRGGFSPRVMSTVLSLSGLVECLSLCSRHAWHPSTLQALPTHRVRSLRNAAFGRQDDTYPGGHISAAKVEAIPVPPWPCGQLKKVEPRIALQIQSRPLVEHVLPPATDTGRRCCAPGPARRSVCLQTIIAVEMRDGDEG